MLRRGLDSMCNNPPQPGRLAHRVAGAFWGFLAIAIPGVALLYFLFRRPAPDDEPGGGWER